jgi:hypothetical protein
MTDIKNMKLNLRDSKHKLKIKGNLRVTAQLAFKEEDANRTKAAAAAPVLKKRRNLQLMTTLIGKRDGSKIEMTQI